MRFSRPLFCSVVLSILASGLPRALALHPAATESSARRDQRESRDFRIPASDASMALETFSAQAGTALVYVLEHVRGVRTNSLHGRFAPREALERLVAKTALMVVEDARTGALMIKRRPPAAPAENPLSLASAETDPTHQHPMKPPRSSRLRGWLPALLTVLTAAANAQSTSPEGVSSASKADDAVVLSPFTVSSERDTGYQATSTLAGSRLNTPIKDIGASISVYTKDFLNDIGATNVNELLIYATGSEAAGPNGNFSNGAGANITEAGVVGDGTRNSPQSGSRVRGLSSPTYTRGFFTSDIAIDGYNTSAVTVNRGPNAILFGVASPAGVVDTTLIQADLQRNLNKVELRYGNNDSVRSSVDFNRVLIPQKLALRLAALYDDDRYNQRPAFQEQRRLYAAINYQPFRSTIIRGNFETGKTDANRPFTVLPFNSFQTWLDAGRKPFDWTFYDDPARNPLAASQNANGGPAAAPFRGLLISQVQIFDTLAWQIADPSRNGGVISTGFRPTTVSSPLTGAGALTRYSIRENVFDPVFNRDSARDDAYFQETRNVFELPAIYYADNRVPAGLKNQGFTDFSVFDWRNRQLDETGRQGDSFSTYQLAFEQRAWEDRIGVEVAYFEERYDRDNRNNYLSTQANANHLRIDPNVTLPDGRPNPNVGRPYVDSGQAIFNRSLRKREAIRATPYIQYDFKDVSSSWGKWVGKHTLTGLVERTQRDELNISSKFAYFGQYDDFRDPNPYAFGRLARLIAYVGPSVIGNNNPVSLTPVSMAPIQDGMVVNANFWEVAAGDPAQAKLVALPWTLRQILQSGNFQRDVIKSRAANMMSYWLDDLLITNVGWRRDEDYFFRGDIAQNADNLYLVNRGFDSVSLPSNPPLVAAKEIKSYSAVLRWPQKLLRLPAGMDLSVFANVSENFSANASRVDPYGNLLNSPTGETEEFGLNFSFLDDRFSIRAATYETTVKDADIGRPAAMSAMVNNAILQTALAWVGQVNTHPNASRQADIDLLYSPLPANWKSLYKVSLAGSAATQNLTQLSTQIAGYGDTSDYVATGTEIDLVYNPTRNWRILLNVSKNETVQSNIAPKTQELVNRYRPVLTTLANRPKAAAPANYVFPTDANGNITSFDEGLGQQTLGQYVAQNVDVPLANLLAAEGVSSPEIRKYRANLVTNYTFDRSSKLRGFGVGTGIRWQDKVGIGYPVSYTSSGRVFIDKDNPYYAPDETNVDGWVSYSRKFRNDRFEWKVQLNVRNVIGSQETIAITAQPDGSPASMRLAPERRWYLTNTFRF